MTDITTETVKVFSYCDKKFITTMVMLTMFFIIVFIGSIIAVMNYQSTGYFGILLSVGWFMIVLIWVSGFFIPLDIVKTTQVQKTELKVVQVNGELSNSSGLTVILKDNHNYYSKENIKFDNNIKIQEQGSDYKYIETKIKNTYSTKHEIRAWLKDIPKNHSNVERVLIIPEGGLNQNK